MRELLGLVRLARCYRLFEKGDGERGCFKQTVELRLKRKRVLILCTIYDKSFTLVYIGYLNSAPFTAVASVHAAQQPPFSLLVVVKMKPLTSFHPDPSLLPPQ